MIMHVKLRVRRVAVRAGWVLAVVAAAGAVAAVPAVAEDAGSGSSDAAQAASALAVATGSAVTVDAATTAESVTVANPDGSFTATLSAGPARVRDGDGWQAVDRSLRVGDDGRLAPVAVGSSVELSDGGAGPLAVLADEAGHSLSVSFGSGLPSPVVSGDTATYADVLPGVDLVATTTVYGGVREVLVVHDAAAASNPALTSIAFTTVATGLSLSAGVDGSVTAADTASGESVFTAPPPVMWDSTLPPGVESAEAGDTTDGGESVASSVAGPGVAARRAVVADSVQSDALVLSPPSDALTGPDVRYPVYIDPPWTPSQATADGYIQSNHPTTVEYNPGDNLRVGYDDWTTNCGDPCYINGVTRSFLRFAVGSLDGKYIQSASLELHQIRTSCTTGGPDTIDVAITSGNASFGSSTDWNNAPAASGVRGSAALARGSGDRSIGTTTVMSYAASHNYGNMYLIVYAANESVDCAYRHFSLLPSMSVTYWSVPNTPASLKVQGQNCVTSSPGPWLAAVTGNQASLSDTVSTPDINTDLTAHFYLSANGGAYQDFTTPAHEGGTANAPVNAHVDVTLADGASYRWYATAANQFQTSPVSSTCYFRYDATAPTAPVVTSTVYPPDGPSTVTPGGSGPIAFTADDPGGGGVASYNYNVNGASLTAPGEQNTTGTSVSVATSDLHWGTNTLWVQAVDGAGNVSTAVAYTFYVQQAALGTYTPGIAGDIDGDGTPDLVSVDAAGAIRVYSSPETTSVNPDGGDPSPRYGGTVLIPADGNARWPMPDSASAAGALVTHGGSFSANNYDDLLIEQNGHLAVANNPGTSGTWTFGEVDVAKPGCGACADYNDQDWSSVVQLVALPTVAEARPDLLTVEVVNGVATLWHYPASSSLYDYDPPTAVSTSSGSWAWDACQLLGAGVLPGSTGSSLWVRRLGDGQVMLLPDVEAGIADPASAAVAVGSPLPAADFPLLSTFGRADSDGNLALWATDSLAGGMLALIPTTTSGGVTTMGTVRTVSDAGWAAHQLALGSGYTPHDNAGIGADGTGNAQAFDTATDDGFVFSATALDGASLDPDVIVNDGAGGCPTGWSTCSAGVGGANTLYLPSDVGGYDAFMLPASWAQRVDNDIAAGQVLAAPVPNTSGPAHVVRFLGAAATTDPDGASVEATITYTNGDTQAVTIILPDWTSTPVAGDTVVASTSYRLRLDGTSDAMATSLFATPEFTLLDGGDPLGADVQIASITLSANAAVHIFAISVN
jgi:hypothetical protein